MSRPLQNFRKIVPWNVKFGLKIVKGILPLNYSLFAKLGFFRHGTMDDPNHALEVFTKHFPNQSDFPISPFVFLEIGPGDSLFSAIIASSKGASKSFMVDYGDFVSKDTNKYLKLIEMLYGADYFKSVNLKTFEDILKHFNIIHLTNGLESLKSIPEKSVDLSFSNACFEHVYSHEVFAYFKEIRRISKSKTLSSHCIDFKDHLSYSLNNLRFSKEFWEKEIVKKSGIYTNRMRFSEMKKLTEQAGFTCSVSELKTWDVLPIDISKLHQDFQTYQMEDLLIKEAWIRLT